MPKNCEANMESAPAKAQRCRQPMLFWRHRALRLDTDAGLMIFSRRLAVALLVLMLACSGCVTTVRPTAEGETQLEATPPKTRYEPESNLNPESIASLRAAPPPAQAEFAAGKSPLTDEDQLGAAGYVRIGIGYYRDAGAAAGVPRDALQQAQEIGAEKAMVYAPDAQNPETRVAYYVRMKLPFGATFRELTAAERQKVGSGGVQLGSIVGGSPASRANLLPGDIVVKIDGVEIASKADFQKRLKASAGHRVSLLIWRNGAAMQREVRLGVAPVEAKAK